MRPPGKQQGRAAPRLTLAAATLAAAGLLAVLCFAAARPEPEPQPAWRQRGDAFPTRQPAANATATLTLQPTAAAAGAATAPAPGQLRLASEPLHPRARAPTLVVYVYGGRDAEYPENARFFINEAVKEGDGCSYVIVLQEGPGVRPLDPLPPLPPNARYLRHPNACLDWGTVGWVLDALGQPALDQFEFFVWANPSVRGPFLPPYLRGRMHWTEPLLSKLSPTVKLVGPTINCGGSTERGPAAHVQSFVAATDAAGLQVLRATGTVFRCWASYAQTVAASEMGASQAMLAAGYNIDCLMLRYQGVDWRDPAVHQRACNGGLNPTVHSMHDGLFLDPLEVMWVKVKSGFLAAGWQSALAAAKYSRWAQEADAAAQRAAAGLPPTAAWLEGLAANAWTPPKLEPGWRPECFDWVHYLSSSADLASWTASPLARPAAWRHFSEWGLAEARPFRFIC